MTSGSDSMQLSPGDAVVNLGDDAHWHNPGPGPVYLASVSIGAQRDIAADAHR